MTLFQDKLDAMVWSYSRVKSYRDVLDEDAAEPEREQPSTPAINNKSAEASGARCPECGEEISFEGGCNICKACGWSKCG